MSWNLRKEIEIIYFFDNNVANDDKLLIAKVWERHGWNSDKDLYTNLKHMPSPETIRRTRQKLVADGVLKQSEQARERRYQAFKDYRNEYCDY